MPDFAQHPEGKTEFWMARCGPPAKGAMILVLMLAFIVQTFLVYTDPTDTVQLDSHGIAGRQIWLANNCQACHQLHGFGGFLGPDLTNAASRIQMPQLADQLLKGKGQMPRYELEAGEVEQLWAFLEAMNETGIGQARSPSLRAGGKQSSQVQSLVQFIDQSNMPEVARGLAVFQASTCTACHTLFAESAVNAPDLSYTASRFAPDEIIRILEQGVSPGMPPSGLSDEDQWSVERFIAFVGEHREEILSQAIEKRRESFWESLPWWEYE